LLLAHDPASDPLRRALALRRAAGSPGALGVARERRAPGLRVSDIVCTSGPTDSPFDERHPRVSIAAVLAGSFAYRGEHGRALLTPGSLLLGNVEADFRCSHEHGEGDRCLAFHFDADAFERLAGALGARQARFRVHRMPPARATARLVARAEAAFDDGEALEEVALGLAAAALRANQDVRPAAVTPSDERRAAEIARLLEAELDRRHGLSELARRAGMSPFHLLRVFRRVVGATPHQFLLRLRLRAAARLLRATAAPVTDIAYAVGFADLSHFVRSFRAEFATPPSRYRAAGARAPHR
jgi:AraC-like DNA-binding protein